MCAPDLIPIAAVLLILCDADDLLNQREKNKLLQEEMETTLHDIQNM